jgi:hypothetical protein
MFRFQLETIGCTGSRTHTRFTPQTGAQFLLYLQFSLECHGNYLCGWLRKKGLLFIMSFLCDFKTEQNSTSASSFQGIRNEKL